MLPAERLETIKEYLREKKFARIGVLEKQLDVSRATVRRSFLQLERENFLRMVRGGAVLASGEGNAYEQPYSQKRDSNQEEKRRIARRAAEIVRDDFSVFLDASTTVAEITDFLADKKNLMIATNDLLIASKLKDCPNMTVTVLGGVLRRNYYTLTGLFTETLLAGMNFDCALLGMDAVSEKGGFMLTNTEEVQIKRIVAQAAGKLVVLCDHTKFDKSSFINVCGFPDVDMVITGRELDPQVYERYRESGPEIVLV